MANEGNAIKWMAKMADSDSESDSDSDINKKKLLLREKQRKKFSLTPSPTTKSGYQETTLSWEVAISSVILRNKGKPHGSHQKSELMAK